LDTAQYTGDRIAEIERQAESTGASLRDTAKWIVSGIAVATAGVIAGASLSSLGALGFDLRLLVAIAMAVIGYSSLGYLFAAALAVIVPRDYTLRDIAEDRGRPAGWKERIEEKLKPLPGGFSTLIDFCDYADNPKIGSDGQPLSDDALRNFNLALRGVRATAKAVEHDLQFRRLKRRTFVTTPFIAAAFIAYSWAANPAKEQDVPTMEKTIDMNPGDLPLLRKLYSGTPACVTPTLQVIVLGEWPSGVQDVVTVPSPSCPPVRLRLDQGRISAAR
jgi:hypothetical protein